MQSLHLRSALLSWGLLIRPSRLPLSLVDAEKAMLHLSSQCPVCQVPWPTGSGGWEYLAGMARWGWAPVPPAPGHPDPLAAMGLGPHHSQPQHILSVSSLRGI